MRHLVLAALALGAMAAPALAGVIRVPQDHATIQAAVNAALPGDKIVIGPGAYPENVIINAKSNLLIRGRGLVTINPPVGAAIGVTASSGVRIKGVSTVTPTSTGIGFIGSPDGLVAKCRMQGSLGFGALSSNGTRIVACKVSSTVDGIRLIGLGTHTAERCRITSAAPGRAIQAGAETAILIRCKVSYTGVPGQSPIVFETSVRGVAERCRVQTAPAGPGIFGIKLDPAAPAAQLELVRNRIEGCNFGIAASTPVTNVVCLGNSIAATGASGLGFGGSTNLTISRNKILLGAGSQFGVFFIGVSSSSITRNKIVGAATGVLMVFGTGNVVSGNKLKNLTFGVSLSGTAHTVGPDNKYRNVATPINDGGIGTIILDSP